MLLAEGAFLTKYLRNQIPFLHLKNMNKKIFLLFISVMLFLVPVFSQSNSPLKKLYAYKQGSASGVKPGLSDRAVTKQSGTYNYWFYLVFPASEKLSVTEIWLSGKKFSVKAEPINDLPVKRINNIDASGNDTMILVPFTKNAVLLTYPAAVVNDSVQVSKYFSDLLRSYELVITYYCKGRKYYKVAKKITVLEPVVRM